MFSPFDFDLFDLFVSVKELYKTQIAHKNLELTINCAKNQKIFADMNMMEAIIRNLVKNSIKYTQKGGSIKCDVSANDHFFEITVSDNGIGMSEKRASNLFAISNIFSEKGTEGEKGTGLGLQIVKEYIAAHNGNICVESKLGEGSTFKLSFPIGSKT